MRDSREHSLGGNSTRKRFLESSHSGWGWWLSKSIPQPLTQGLSSPVQSLQDISGDSGPSRSRNKSSLLVTEVQPDSDL